MTVIRGKFVALGDIEVVGVVGGGYFYCAGAELGIDCGVGDHGDGAVEPGEGDVLANEICEAFIVGVDGDGSVAEEGLGAGGGDGEVAGRV